MRIRLGYRLDDIEGFEPVDHAIMLQALLRRTGTEELGPELTPILQNVLTGLGDKPALIDTEIAMVRDIVADLRIVDGRSIYGVLRAHPELIPPLLPEIIARIEAGVPGSEHTNNELGYLLVAQPPEILKPYADRIFAIVERRRDWTAAPLFAIIGRLGPDPVKLFQQALNNEKTAKPAVIGICTSDSGWAPRLVPALTAYLGKLRIPKSGSPPDAYLPGILALRRFGHSAEAEALIAKLPEKRQVRLRQDLDRRAEGDIARRCRR